MTKTMYMLQLWLDQRVMHELARMLHLPLREVELEYLSHCALGELFQDNAPATFCVERAPSEQRQLQVIAYSELALEELRAIATAFASPKVYNMVDWQRSCDKPMPTRFPSGMILGFETKVCPVVRLASACTDSRGPRPRHYAKGKELDAYQAACLRHDGHEEMPERASIYQAWARLRLEADQATCVRAQQLESFSLEKMFRRTKAKQDGARKPHVLTRPVVQLRGELEVRDEEAFQKLLKQGIGRHRGFGFGMLKLRRART